MIDWHLIILAFLAGVILVFLLEVSRRWGRAWRWLALVSALVFLPAIVLFLLARSSNDVVVDHAEIRASFVVEDGEDTAVSLLPPPSIFTLTATPTISASIEKIRPQTNSPATLSIPALDIKQTIVDVPLQDGAWNVADLGEHVGLLAGVGQRPGDEMAMVLAGHMTFPSSRNLLQGAFANLQYALYGTDVILQMEGEQVRYEVVQIDRVDPNDIDQLRVYDGDSILLVTCTDWDENGRFYVNRLVIRAERVDKG